MWEAAAVGRQHTCAAGIQFDILTYDCSRKKHKIYLPVSERKLALENNTALIVNSITVQ